MICKWAPKFFFFFFFDRKKKEGGEEEEIHLKILYHG